MATGEESGAGFDEVDTGALDTSEVPGEGPPGGGDNSGKGRAGGRGW